LIYLFKVLLNVNLVSLEAKLIKIQIANKCVATIVRNTQRLFACCQKENNNNKSVFGSTINTNKKQNYKIVCL